MIDTLPPERLGRLALLARRLRARREQGINPVLLKELRGRFRGGRAFRTLTAFLILLAGLAFVVLTFSSAQYLAATTGLTGLRGANGRAITGQSLYGMVVLAEGFFIALMAPVLTMSAISGERERKTLELLLATPLSGSAIVLGKVAAAMAFLCLVVFSALPVVSLAFLYGGISLVELVTDQVAILCTGLLFATLGAFFSTITERSGRALILTFAFLGALTVLRWGITIFSLGVSLLGPFSGLGAGSVFATDQIFLAESMRYLYGLPSITGRAATALTRSFGNTAPWLDLLSTTMSAGYWILLTALLITVSGARLRGASAPTLSRVNRLVIAIWIWNILGALVDVPVRRAMLSSWGSSFPSGGSVPSTGPAGAAAASGFGSIAPWLTEFLASGLGAALPVFPVLIWLIARGFLPPVRGRAR